MLKMINKNNDIAWDNKFFEIAMEQAKIALADNEIPVGAVLVRAQKVILAAHNRTRQLENPLAHAEKLIIDKVIHSGIKYLSEYTMYVTLEPCMMCAGMIVWSRLGRLVFGAKDSKAGCVGSIYNVLLDNHFNHHPVVKSGLMAEESETLLKEFFKAKRKKTRMSFPDL